MIEVYWRLLALQTQICISRSYNPTRLEPPSKWRMTSTHEEVFPSLTYANGGNNLSLHYDVSIQYKSHMHERKKKDIGHVNDMNKRCIEWCSATLDSFTTCLAVLEYQGTEMTTR